MLARLARNFRARALPRQCETIGREREQLEVVVVPAMATRRTGPAISRLPEIIDRQPETCVPILPFDSFRKSGAVGRNVIDRPMMPGAAGRIGIVTEQRKTAYSRRHIAPFQWR